MVARSARRRRVIYLRGSLFFLPKYGFSCPSIYRTPASSGDDCIQCLDKLPSHCFDCSLIDKIAIFLRKVLTSGIRSNPMLFPNSPGDSSDIFSMLFTLSKKQNAKVNKIEDKL